MKIVLIIIACFALIGTIGEANKDRRLSMQMTCIGCAALLALAAMYMD